MSEPLPFAVIERVLNTIWNETGEHFAYNVETRSFYPAPKSVKEKMADLSTFAEDASPTPDTIHPI